MCIVCVRCCLEFSIISSQPRQSDEKKNNQLNFKYFEPLISFKQPDTIESEIAIDQNLNSFRN